MTAGTASRPTIHRQPMAVFQSSLPILCTSLLTNRVMKTPLTMATWKSDPSRPRSFSGAISAM